MTYDANIGNLTDEELIRHYQHSDDPLVRELVSRLARVCEDLDDLREELNYAGIVL